MWRRLENEPSLLSNTLGHEGTTLRALFMHDSYDILYELDESKQDIPGNCSAKW